MQNYRRGVILRILKLVLKSKIKSGLKPKSSLSPELDFKPGLKLRQKLGLELWLWLKLKLRLILELGFKSRLKLKSSLKMKPKLDLLLVLIFASVLMALPMMSCFSGCNITEYGSIGCRPEPQKDRSAEHMLTENGLTVDSSVKNDQGVNNKVTQDLAGKDYIKHGVVGSEEMLQCRFYNNIDFQQSVKNASNARNEYRLKPSEDIIFKGGIVPHHLLAGDMIASFFEIISIEQPDIIIIIAPNHRGIGVKKIHTGVWDWQTPFGILETEESYVNSLLDSGMAAASFDLLEEDHSISALIPYVKYYFPESKIVPVLLHGTLGLKKAKQLGENFQTKIENEYIKSLIIASVDFSHYLPLEAADEMDDISIKTIKDRDTETINNFNNDNMDSPPSIIAVLSAMDAANAVNMDILEHNNSDRIIGSSSGETTSYFTIVFH